MVLPCRPYALKNALYSLFTAIGQYSLCQVIRRRIHVISSILQKRAFTGRFRRKGIHTPARADKFNLTRF
nr:MAG TPA: hypothetical protein [Caudoviricetes sp.]